MYSSSAKNKKKYNLCSVEFLRQNSGFSLIELMVVFIIVAIISAIGLASYKSYSDKQILTSAAQDLKLTIDNTKFNALSSVKPTNCSVTDALTGYKFSLTQASNTYTVSVLCGGKEIVLQTAKTVSQVSVLPSSTCTQIQFASLNGQAAGASCVINLSAYSKTATLSIDQVGNVSIVMN